MALVAVCVVAALWVATLVRPEIGVWLLVFSMWFEGYALETKMLVISAPNVAILMIAVATGIRVLSRQPVRLGRVHLWFFGLLAWLVVAELLAVGASPSSVAWAGLRPLLNWLGFAMTYLGIALWCRKKVSIRRTLVAWGVGMALLTAFTFLILFGVVQLPYVPPYGKVARVGKYVLPFPRLKATPFSFGYLGMLLSGVLPFMLVGLSEPRVLGPSRLALGVGCVFVIATALVTGSRSVWLSVAITCVMVVWLLQLQNIRERRRLAWSVTGLVVPIVLTVLLWSPLYHLGQLLVESNSYTVEERLSLNRAALSTFSDHVVIGVGTTTLEREFTETYGNVVHNKFIGLLASVGLVGFFPFVLLWLRHCYICWQVMETDADRWSIVMGAACLAGTIGMVAQLQFFGGESIKPAAVLMALAANCRALAEGSETRRRLPADPDSEGRRRIT